MLNIKKEEPNELRKVIDNIRGLGIDMIANANSGHPGIVLGAAPIITTLYANHLKIDVDNPTWINRDRFVFSAGHGSALLYATLFMAGYDLDFEELKKFRKIGSLTPGHPEYGITKGVEATTGPLGQGVATAVGMAISEVYLREYFGKDIIDYHTFVLCSDGDLSEGVSYEACSLAGHLELNKLILLYDSNDITLDGNLKDSFSENIKERFESQKWNYILVNDGENIDLIDEAIIKAKASTKPTIIEIKTVIGKYSENEGTAKVHGSPLSEEDILAIKNKLGLRTMPFTVSLDTRELFKETIANRNRKKIISFNENLELIKDKKEFNQLINSHKPIKINDIYYNAPEDDRDSTRAVSGQVINSLAKSYPFLIGGSADLTKSTFAKINDTKDFSNATPNGRNINFGIREHAMAAIANGMALSNLTPFVSTFLTFSDYLKPSLRLSALMNLPVIYVFTHDSISLGEDGPTHQPIEQLVALRAVPNLDVYRPADANETIGAYLSIMDKRSPAAIVLSRNKVKIQDVTKVNEVTKGAYIVAEERKKLEFIITSSGEELELALGVWKNLDEKGYGVRLVSMPSMSLFEETNNEYQEEILPKKIPTFVIEASSSLSWYKYVLDDDYLFTIDTFGESGNKEDLYKHFGFTINEIETKIEEKINKSK